MPPMQSAPPSPMGGGTGAVTAPGPMAGSAAQGMAKVKTALEMLQAALPTIPMGGELHADVMKAVSSLSKHLGDNAGQGGANVIQQLMEAMRNAKTQGAPAMPGAPPGGAPSPGGMPMPMGGAAGAPPPMGGPMAA